MAILDFKPLELADKDLFNKYMKGRGYRHFDASFSNMFMLADAGNIFIAHDENALYISQSWKDYTPFMLPPYPIDKNVNLALCLDKAKKYMLDTYGHIYFKLIIPELRDRLINSGIDKYQFIYDASNSEYVYTTSDLINLSGKKYHSKRNHIRKFINSYDYEMIEYTPELSDVCIDVQKKWMAERTVTYDEECEFTAVKRAIDNFDDLDLKGCILKVDGKYAAFSFAERISDDTVLIHIEKCLAGYEGIYQFINQEFLRKYFSDTTYVNRAEDMGIDGLRKAKQSYYPCFMIERYDLLFK